MANNIPSLPGDLDTLRPWFDLVRRMNLAAHERGPSVVTCRAVIDEAGRPVAWNVQQVQLEPRGRFNSMLEVLQSLPPEQVGVLIEMLTG